MSLAGLIDAFGWTSAHRRMLDALAQDGALEATAPDAAKPLVIAALRRELGRPVLALCPQPDDARRLLAQLEAYCEPETPILHFAEAEVLPYERLSVEAGTARERIRALWALASGEGAPPVVVASVTGLLQKTMSPEALREGAQTIRRGDRVAVEPMLTHWARMGYAVGPMVDHPGTAARRGGIIDVFGAGAERPARLDLWGDVADSIRFFDPNTQRSEEETDAVTVLPAAEALPGLVDQKAADELVRGLDFTNAGESERERVQDELAELLAGVSGDNGALYAGFLLRHTLLDHLPEDAVVVLDEPFEAEEAARRLEGNAERLRLAKEERGSLPMGFPAPLADWDGAAQALEAAPTRLTLSRYHRAEGGGRSLQ